jgi:hypothetical protein
MPFFLLIQTWLTRKLGIAPNRRYDSLMTQTAIITVIVLIVVGFLAAFVR